MEETAATINQTTYADLLDAAPDLNDSVMRRRNMELYNMLLKAIQGGGKSHIMNNHEDSQDGHAAWKSLQEWYGSSKVSRSVINHHRKVPQRLVLDANTTGTEYIYTFIISTQELGAKAEKISPEKIVDLDYLNTSDAKIG